MKKREKKLQLNRETVLRLDDKDLREAEGGVWTSCIEPNCCGFEQKADTV
jgi:hypothetical protein